MQDGRGWKVEMGLGRGGVVLGMCGHQQIASNVQSGVGKLDV